MSTLEPSVYTVVELFGFVEELVVDSDPGVRNPIRSFRVSHL